MLCASHPINGAISLKMYSFESIVACRGYHIYKDTTWQKTRVGEIVKVEVETNQNSTQIDPYACAIKVKNVFYDYGTR